MDTNLDHQKVTIFDCSDVMQEINHKSICLPYRTFDKLRSVKRADVVESKRLSEVSEFNASEQSQREAKLNQDAPRRTGQTGHMLLMPFV